jgi:hypothetical protein
MAAYKPGLVPSLDGLTVSYGKDGTIRKRLNAPYRDAVLVRSQSSTVPYRFNTIYSASYDAYQGAASSKLSLDTEEFFLSASCQKIPESAQGSEKR